MVGRLGEGAVGRLGFSNLGDSQDVSPVGSSGRFGVGH
jgi:hypothetical protein